MAWYLAVLKKYAVFTGRARRKEYWYFSLFNTLIVIALAIIDGMAKRSGTQHHFGLLTGLYCLAVVLPSLAVAVRRLHDTNRSGWWTLLGLVPLIGAIVLLLLYVQDSQWGENRYGPNPKPLAPPAFS